MKIVHEITTIDYRQGATSWRVFCGIIPNSESIALIYFAVCLRTIENNTNFTPIFSFQNKGNINSIIHNSRKIIVIIRQEISKNGFIICHFCTSL